MPLFKFFIAAAVISGLCGVGVFTISEGVDVVNDLDVNWGRGGGGCHGGSSYYSGDDSEYSHCHEESYSENDEGYCPYHDEYFSEEEWEEHYEDCPMNE